MIIAKVIVKNSNYYFGSFVNCSYLIGVVKSFNKNENVNVTVNNKKVQTAVLNFRLEAADGVSIHLCVWKERFEDLQVAEKIQENNVRSLRII